MSDIKLGNNDITFKVGSTDVDAIYLGNELVYSASTPPTPSYDNVITYEALAKLTETTSNLSGGVHTYAFSGTNGQLTITSHTFSNGVGRIEFNNDVKTVGTYAFFNCGGATSITIPSSVTRFDNQPFWGCTGLTAITINAINAPTFDRLVFDNTNNCAIYVPCNSLVDYASDSMFFNYSWTSRLKGISPCTNKVRYYNSGTTCHNYDLYQVVALQLSTDNGSTWSYVSPAVTQEYLLEENSEDCGYTPSGSGNVITYEAWDEISFDEFAFRDEFGGILNVESHTFDGNQGTIIFERDITSIGNQAFQNCFSLTSIDIPNSVIDIGSNVFYGCGSLTSVTVGSGVMNINDYAFSALNELVSFTIYAEYPPTLGYSAFNDTPIENGQGTIYVPMESVEDYINDPTWNQFNIEPIIE